MAKYIDWELHTPVGKWKGRATTKSYMDILIFTHANWKDVDELCIPVTIGEALCVGIECLKHSVLRLKEGNDE